MTRAIDTHDDMYNVHGGWYNINGDWHEHDHVYDSDVVAHTTDDGVRY